MLPLASPPSSAEKTPSQGPFKIDTSANKSYSLPLSPPRTLESPERANPVTPVSAGGSLISRRKAAPHPISVPAQKGVLGVVVEKKSLPGLDLVGRTRRDRTVISPVVHVVPSSAESTALGSRPGKTVAGKPPMPQGAVEIVKEVKVGHMAGLTASETGLRSRSRTISRPTVLDKSTTPPAIPVMLSDDIAYPFAHGIYPSRHPQDVERDARSAVALGRKPALVENALLSGVLDGLDRTKERPAESASVPLFRFGYPYLIENDSADSTRESRLRASFGRLSS